MASTAQTSPNRAATELFDGLAPRYDRLGYVLSFGQDRRWRRELVEHVRERPAARVLDVATGTGGIARALRTATGAFVVGVDLTWEMLAAGRAAHERAGDRRVAVVQARAEQLPFRDGAFDAVGFSYLLRYVADPAATLQELSRPLKPGGTLASLEFHVPPAPAWRGLWWCYTRTVLPAAGRLLGGREWQHVGSFLGPSISGHYRRLPLRRHVKIWEDAGIRQVGTRLMSVGGGLVMWGRKATEPARGRESSRPTAAAVPDPP
jgi:demethylmenaquinone methyltransferase/2-methoxy-6-polyprenyl-1,4-benzoquinol methylase